MSLIRAEITPLQYVGNGHKEEKQFTTSLLRLECLKQKLPIFPLGTSYNYILSGTQRYLLEIRTSKLRETAAVATAASATNAARRL